MTKPVHGGNLAWAATIAGCPTSAIIDFSASINPLGPPNSALQAIQSNINQLRAYPDPSYQELKKAISLTHPPLTPEWVLPGNGAAELLTWAALELSKLETTYLLVPAFSDYWRALKTFAANVVECPLEIGEWKLEQLAIKSDISKGLLLNNPHNPTGMLMELESIVPFLEKFGLVVVDEAFMDFLPPPQLESLIPLVTKFDNLVILRSLTKFYSLPGLRIGYVISHPERLRKWEKWRDPWSVNSLAIAAAQAVLEDKVFQEQTWNWLSKACPQLFQGLAELPGLQPYSGAANFLLVKSEKSVDQLQIKLLKEYQILIRDCLSFAELGDRYFRVAVRTQEENQKLIDALAKIL
ncbi:threonine-phosphate decarboxylase CobD [Okeania sp.]|uniref:threonine-phosphate decarboxylase CobD n=1 Tax=Okeania sp. TaxID=3100323 RepID=UPI002B4B84C9|nr:threonine-phosphate decarboxylase CobD [Okeania sp.]MEB3340371.1 threonine-phosphate decarboxylase CobD [Okeania sp.]